MKKEQKHLIKILLKMINGEEIGPTKGWAWNKILHEAEEHQIKGMLYPLVDKEVLQRDLAVDLYEGWKRTTFLQGVGQMRHMMQVQSVLSLLLDAGIQVIVLKGLVLRALYPRPELRTMCDADLLLRSHELERARMLLTQLGYELQETSPIHYTYCKEGALAIELHWTIQDQRLFDDSVVVEDALWAQAVPVQIGNLTVHTLSKEDTVIHLCAHMAVHLSEGGFGIRQILDLALFTKQQGNTIDWREVSEKAKVWHLEQFILTLYAVIETLFKIATPEDLVIKGSVNKRVVKQLIHTIWASGVYGKRERIQVLTQGLAKDHSKGKQGKDVQVEKRFLCFLFPTVQQLRTEYEYVKKHHWMLPLAWLHHGWKGIIHKEYSLKEKIQFLLTAYYRSKNRNKLLRDLEI